MVQINKIMKKIKFFTLLAAMLMMGSQMFAWQYEVAYAQADFNNAETTTKSGNNVGWDNNNDGIRLGSTIGGGLNWDDKYVSVVLPIPNMESTITFSYKASSSLASGPEWYIAESSDNQNWTNIWEKSSNSTTATNDQANISANAKYVKLCYSGNFAGYFFNVKVTPKPHTVTLDHNDGTGNKSTVTANYNKAMPAASAPDARTGYNFKGFFDAQVGGNQYYTAAMASAKNWDKTGNTTLYAQWEAIEYAITYEGVEGATNTNPATYTIEDEITLVAPTKAGYTFLDWSDGGTIAKGSTGNKTFTASWELIPTSKEAGEIAWNEKALEDVLTTNTPTGKHSTICLPYNCTVEGALIYAYQDERTAEGLVFDIAEQQVVEAGKAYIFFATADSQAWTKVAEENPAKDVYTEGLLVGTYADFDLTAGDYFLHRGEAGDEFCIAGSYVYAPAFRAYLPKDNMPGEQNAAVRVVFPNHNPIVTGVENLNEVKATKALVNGKIIIRKGAHTYDLNGALLK